MKRIFATSLIALSAVLISLPANAQGFRGYGNINSRQAQLQARINNGISSRRLSRSEAAKLQYKMNRIGNLESRMRASGGLSFRERNNLNRQLASLRNEINRDMNDFERRRIGFFERYWR
ncbi:MAG: hypothetical protein IT343_21035 [Candidatus Melainabacteria bacterium]|jgi:hypothetical protein|nr:hypothetical protein [Candidatus Melainabacteria bacterium]